MSCSSLLFCLKFLLLLLCSTTNAHQHLRTNVGNDKEPVDQKQGILEGTGSTGSEPVDQKKQILQGSGNTGSCSWLIKCSTCTQSEGCGWCSDCMACTEGGATGPSTTNCMAYDYDQCSGENKFADLMLASHESELKQRSLLILNYEATRDQFVQAKQEVAAMEETVKKTKEMKTASKSISSNDESSTFALTTEKETAATACDRSKDQLTKTDKELSALIQKVQEQELIVDQLQTDKERAMENGQDDTAKIDETVRETTEMLAMTKDSRATVEKKLQTAKTESTTACEVSTQAANKYALHQGALTKANAGLNGAAGMYEAMVNALVLKKKEATRAKEKAIEIATQLKKVTKELRELRQTRTA